MEKLGYLQTGKGAAVDSTAGHAPGRRGIKQENCVGGLLFSALRFMFMCIGLCIYVCACVFEAIVIWYCEPAAGQVPLVPPPAALAGRMWYWGTPDRGCSNTCLSAVVCGGMGQELCELLTDVCIGLQR